MNLTLHVWCDGDRSVGIPGDSATVVLDSVPDDEKDRAEYVNAAKQVFAKAFGDLWDWAPKYVHVMTDKELES